MKCNSINESIACKYPYCIFVVIFVLDRMRLEIRTQAISVGRFGKIVLRFDDVIESVSFLLLFVRSLRGSNQMS